MTGNAKAHVLCVPEHMLAMLTHAYTRKRTHAHSSRVIQERLVAKIAKSVLLANPR